MQIMAASFLAFFLFLAPTAPLAPPSPQAKTQAGTATYKVDSVHSNVLFRIKHIDISYFYGRFNDISGTFTLNEKTPKKSVAMLEIRTDSVDTKNPKRDQDLRGPDFLNARQFPVIRFESTAVSKKGKVWKVTGNLTLRGVTKKVTVPLTWTGAGPDPWGGRRIGFEGTVTLKRGDFGIDYAKGAVGDEVRLTFSLESVLQKN